MIKKIEGLDELKNLSTLYLQENLINTIENLENVKSLKLLDVSRNLV